MSAEHHTFTSGYQGPYASQVAAPWTDNMDPAMSMESSGLPASDQLLHTHKDSTLYQGLPAEYHHTTEPFPTYTEQDFAQDLGSLHTVPDVDFASNGPPELELKFEMKEPVEVRLPTDEEVAAAEPSEPYGDGEDEDAEGVEDNQGEDEDAEGSEDDTAIKVSPSDHGYHSQAEDHESAQPLHSLQPQQVSQPEQPSQPQSLPPKIYIRVSNKKAQAAEAKKSDSTTQGNELKRPSTTSIEELVDEHGGGAPRKRARFEGGYTEPNTSSSPTPSTKSGKKRHATPVEEVTNEHRDGRPHKKAKTHREHTEPASSPLPKPVTQSKPARSRKQNAQKGGRILSMKEAVPSSLLPTFEPVPPPHRFSVQIPKRIIELFDGLKNQGHRVLPDLEKDEQIIPWTAQQLTLLYIYSYKQNNVELCDLITDVWVRAFQERNRDKKLPKMWRPNKSHPERDLTVVGRHMKEYHRNGLPPVPHWQQKLLLPMLSDCVTEFDPKLLNQLYHYTAEANGARMLWADALALCGYAAEDWFIECKKEKIEVHEDLVHNVLCTTLRMCRRRLTLKIEETLEDAWCQRYHMHSQWGMACHRPKEDEMEKQAAQGAALPHATNTGGDIEVQDDFDAALLRGFDSAFESAGDGYDPSTEVAEGAQGNPVNIDDGDDGDSSEED
jgi:hypothetical protein